MDTLKIINVSTEDITFDTFDLTAGSQKDIVWNSSQMTQETFGQMLAMHDLEMLEFVDALGNQVNYNKVTEQYIGGEIGGIDQDIDLEFNETNLNYFNDNDLMSY